MDTGIALLALGAIDAGAVFVAFWLTQTDDRSDSDDVVPLSVLLPVIACVLLAHLLGTGFVGSTVDLSSPGGRLIVLGGSVFCGFWPAIVYARMLTKSLSDSAVNQLYGMNTARKQETDCTGARAAYHRGDVDEALRLYRRLTRDNPHNAGPLLEADQMLKTEGRDEDRLEVLRDVLAKFKDDLGAWAEAAFNMAELQEHHLEDQRSADAIRREIIKRVPKSDYANMAREILMKRQSADSS